MTLQSQSERSPPGLDLLCSTPTKLERRQHALLLWCKSSLMTSKLQFVTETLKFPSIVGPPLRVRANSYILISLSLLLLPLMSPPIPFRANSKLICKSQRQRNWCLIFELGNRIMWVMRKGWRKNYREGERQKRRQLDIKNELLCLFLSPYIQFVTILHFLLWKVQTRNSMTFKWKNCNILETFTFLLCKRLLH